MVCILVCLIMRMRAVDGSGMSSDGTGVAYIADKF